MPYEIIWEEEGAFCNCFGIVTLQEIAQMQSEFHNSDAFNKTKYYIWSSLNIEKISFDNISYIDIPAAMSTAASADMQQLKVTFVIKDNYIKQVVQRYIETAKKHRNPWEFRIFETVEEARKWIGL